MKPKQHTYKVQTPIGVRDVPASSPVHAVAKLLGRSRLLQVSPVNVVSKRSGIVYTASPLGHTPTPPPPPSQSQIKDLIKRLSPERAAKLLKELEGMI